MPILVIQELDPRLRGGDEVGLSLPDHPVDNAFDQ